MATIRSAPVTKSPIRSATRVATRVVMRGVPPPRTRSRLRRSTTVAWEAPRRSSSRASGSDPAADIEDRLASRRGIDELREAACRLGQPAATPVAVRVVAGEGAAEDAAVVGRCRRHAEPNVGRRGLPRRRWSSGQLAGSDGLGSDAGRPSEKRASGLATHWSDPSDPRDFSRPFVRDETSRCFCDLAIAPPRPRRPPATASAERSVRLSRAHSLSLPRSAKLSTVST